MPLTATTDAGTGGLNLLTTRTYNTTNDLLTATDPLKHASGFTYNTNDNLTHGTNALNQSTTYTHDLLGQVTSATDATIRTSTHGYNQSLIPAGYQPRTRCRRRAPAAAPATG